jgi:hypothetical protein
MCFPWGAMSKWMVLALALAVACTGETLTNFGPPGGLSGKVLPAGESEPIDSGGNPPSDGSMMKKCIPPDSGPADAGTGEAAPIDEAGITEAGATEGGAGSDSGTSDAGSGGPTCAVSWKSQIFKQMTAAGQWQCASASCHGGGGVAGPMLSDVATVSYDALVNYRTKLTTTPLPYILPCATDPAKSAFYCNVMGSSCGPQMPLMTNGASLLTPAEVAMVKTWVECGAPNN